MILCVLFTHCLLDFGKVNKCVDPFNTLLSDTRSQYLSIELKETIMPGYFLSTWTKKKICCSRDNDGILASYKNKGKPKRKDIEKDRSVDNKNQCFLSLFVFSLATENAVQTDETPNDTPPHYMKQIILPTMAIYLNSRWRLIVALIWMDITAPNNRVQKPVSNNFINHYY